MEMGLSQCLPIAQVLVAWLNIPKHSRVGQKISLKKLICMHLIVNTESHYHVYYSTQHILCMYTYIIVHVQGYIDCQTYLSGLNASGSVHTLGS